MKTSLDFLALAAGNAGLKINGVDEMRAMLSTVNSFSLIHKQYLTTSQGWHFLALFNQALLAQDPNNAELVNKVLLCIARAAEETSTLATLAASTPLCDGKDLDQLWAKDKHYSDLADVPPAPEVDENIGVATQKIEELAGELAPDFKQETQAVSEPETVPDPEPLAEPEDEAPAELTIDEKFAELEAQQAKEEEAAWREHDSLRGMNYVSQTCWLPDEVIKPGEIVKEYKNHSDFKSGWWREGFPYKICVYPQPGAPKDAPEYFVHYATRPSILDFQPHLRLYHDHICYARVKFSDGSVSSDITREYTGKDANRAVARTALKPTVDDNWTQDADWRIRYFDIRVGYECFEYFEFQPGGLLLAKYHRGKHFAKVENRKEWLEGEKQRVQDKVTAVAERFNSRK